MLRRHTSSDSVSAPGLIDLNESVPTVAGFAHLAARAIAGLCEPVPNLTREAETLLVAAQSRGIFELRANPAEFDSSDRLLAVCVEATPNLRLVFRQTGHPARTLRFLDAFRELCQSGLVIHQLQKEFSLTARGFELASRMDIANYKSELEFSREVEI